MKKLLTILLSVFMAMTMAINVSADNYPGSIEIKNTEAGHTYVVYQLLKGSVATDGSLTEVQWGKNVNANVCASLFVYNKENPEDKTKPANINDATEWATSISGLTAEQTSKYIKDVFDKGLTQTALISTGNPYATATSAGNAVTISNIENGYYLIFDTNQESTVTKPLANYILRVVGNNKVSLDVKAENKIASPTLTKKVKEDHDIDSTVASYKTLEVTYDDYNDTAAYQIGDVVPFIIDVGLPSNYDSFDKYYAKITDTHNGAFNFVDNTYGLYVVNGNSETLVDSSKYTFEKTSSESVETGFEVVITDTKQINGIQNGSHLVFKYEMKLNGNAVTGSTGNKNSAKLTFSNDPKHGFGDSTADTPIDDVLVYTFTLDITKQNSVVNVSGTHNKLQGAEFKLYKASKDAAGNYVDGAEIKVSKNSVTGVYTIDANGSETIVSDANGSIIIKGLDEGYYKLVETVAPNGFTKLTNPIYLQVIIDLKHTQNLNGNPLGKLDLSLSNAAAHEIDHDEEGKFSGELGTVKIAVDNTSSAQLPTTGGMGTTVIYTVGASMVLIAGVLLVVKKKSNN